MRQFDVAHHQPHPPGYPLFILAAKTVHTVVQPEPKALGAVSVVAAALGIIAMFVLLRRLVEPDVALLATVLAATTPLYWFTAARPLSDAFGLAAAVAVQALIAGAETRNALSAAAFLAGLGAGIRSQVLWLTVPLLVAHGFSRVAEGSSRVAQGFSPARPTAAFAAGILVWFIPLVVLTGGPAAYWHALFDQGAEDLSGIQMLWTSPRLRTLIDAMYYAFVAPWASWALAIPILVAASAGAVILARRNRRALLMLAVAFGPYFLFDILFQETFTVRYALPLVIPIAALAAAAIGALPQSLAIAATLPIAMYGAHIGGRSIAAYSREPAPVFRMLADMRAGQQGGALPLLAPDRRLSFDLRRPLAWLGSDAPALERTLASPPQHEWLEAEKYWLAGGRSTVWFAVDPRRAAIDLVHHSDPRSYRYSSPYPVLLSGTRPGDVDWYETALPPWFVGEGWALTPESAGIAAAERKGLSAGAIHAWLSDPVHPPTLMVGGRNFEATVQPRLTVTIDDIPIMANVLGPGAFLHLAQPPRPMPVTGLGLHKLEIKTDPPANVAIEQFDFSRSVLGFGAGWHESEFNPATGLRWRWLSSRGELWYVTDGLPARLRITGETPLRYYSKGSRLVVRAGAQVLSDSVVSDDFTIDVDIPATIEPATLIVETDQTHVPAERRWRRVTDRRELGLRIYSCRFVTTTASAPNRAGNSPPAR